MSYQAFCNLCDARDTELVRRGTFHLCPECATREELRVCQDLATDPAQPSSVRADARRKVRALSHRLMRLVKARAEA
jgi:hypothetical protein